MALIKDYFEKTKLYSDEYGINSIVLMQVGAFYEVYGLKRLTDNSIYGSQIMEFSKICDLNVVDKKVCVGKEAVKMAGFKDMFLEKFVRKLQEAGYTSIVFSQDEPNNGVDIKRSLTGIFSPGTYFSCDPVNINNNSCCIWLHLQKNNLINKMNIKPYIYVGVSIIDIYTGTTFLFEFKEIYVNNPTTFDELERIISCYNPSETIIISNLLKSEVDDIVSFTNIQSSSLHFVSLINDNNNNNNNNKIRAKNCEKQIYQKELLEKFYPTIDFTIFIERYKENVIAIQSFCYLLDFIYQHNPNLTYKIKEPILESIGNRLILANHSLKQLNIIDDQFKGKYSSVLKMLNECLTNMGKRRFAYDFLNPTINEKYLQNEYDTIEYCFTKEDLFNVIKPMLSNISDLTKFHRQIIIKKITPKNLFQLYESLQFIRQIYDIIILDTNLNVYFKNKICKYENLLDNIESLTDFLNRKLCIEDCKEIDTLHKFEMNFIKSGIDKDLDTKLYTVLESDAKLEACRKYFNELISIYEDNNKNRFNKKYKDDKNDYVKINETEKNNFSLIATDRRCKILEEVLKNTNLNVANLKYTINNIEKTFDLEIGKGILEFPKHTASNKFITSKQINQLCKNVSLLKSELMYVINKVYMQIIESLMDYQKHFDLIGEFITLLDVIFTKAIISKKYGYCKPIIDFEADKSFVNVKCLRHCLIEHIQQNEIYVANDIQLGTNAKGSIPYKDGILLYGTNAVGKTSFIRSLGIAVIMAQAGLYVPASSFTYKPYKYIFTRILGNDNLFKGLSTFAVEMSELNSILRLSNKNSLILGDELCSGTESISAKSIFVAGVQQLALKKASFIFATHLHEIIHYEEITNLKNVVLNHMSVFYNKEKDMLIYDRKLKDGPGDNMYGLEVCKSLNLPNDFLELANNIRLKYNPESASILDLKKSTYNSLYLKGICESCGEKMGEEVHHLQYQKDANDNKIIENNETNTKFHKDHAANLLNICKKCHDDIHKKNTKYKKVKTSKGIKLLEI
jgi:DNA mismatch repair protein MutS